MAREHSVMLPDLQMPTACVVVLAWFVRVGERVLEGDRLLEILAGEAALEIDAPASGILLEKRVDIEDVIEPGQILGVIKELS